MRSFISGLAPIINEYLKFRNTLGYSNYHEYNLAKFDNYCHENYPSAETLTKETVHGWVNHELSCGHGDIHNKISSVRMLATYMGNGAYIYPTRAIPKKPKCTPSVSCCRQHQRKN